MVQSATARRLRAARHDHRLARARPVGVPGLINAFDMPARQAFVVEMVDARDDLPNAIALNSSMVNGARLIGPSVAGVLIAAVGEGWCFAHRRHQLRRGHRVAAGHAAQAAAGDAPGAQARARRAARRLSLRLRVRADPRHLAAARLRQPHRHPLHGADADLRHQRAPRRPAHARPPHGRHRCRRCHRRAVARLAHDGARPRPHAVASPARSSAPRSSPSGSRATSGCRRSSSSSPAPA